MSQVLGVISEGFLSVLDEAQIERLKETQGSEFLEWLKGLDLSKVDKPEIAGNCVGCLNLKKAPHKNGGEFFFCKIDERRLVEKNGKYYWLNPEGLRPGRCKLNDAAPEPEKCNGCPHSEYAIEIPAVYYFCNINEGVLLFGSILSSGTEIIRGSVIPRPNWCPLSIKPVPDPVAPRVVSHRKPETDFDEEHYRLGKH